MMKFAVLLLNLTTAAHAYKPLPQGCGPKDAKFDVDTQMHQPAPTPDPTKAQIVFFQSMTKIITRAGIDGAWVGADKGNSWFAVSVTPGEHHLCSFTEPSKWATGQIPPGAGTFTFEAGKTYYYQFTLTNTKAGTGSVSYVTTFNEVTVSDALYQIRTWPLATAKPSK